MIIECETSDLGHNVKKKTKRPVNDGDYMIIDVRHISINQFVYSSLQ